MTKTAKRAGRKSRRTTDGIQILRRRYLKHDAEMAHLVEEQRANMDIARKIYELRERAGLSQRALAKLIGTTASVVCRLEAADYDGHSLAMLNRIAAALDRRVEIRFLPKRNAPRRT
ncbi:MAG: XRE family transcriptional regulator [Planctomycetia bacterium]|nr:XRE family transcriptional regulator [Planctomycetia bacterium]